MFAVSFVSNLFSEIEISFREKSFWLLFFKGGNRGEERRNDVTCFKEQQYHRIVKTGTGSGKIAKPVIVNADFAKKKSFKRIQKQAVEMSKTEKQTQTKQTNKSTKL